jgi:hypothetical protein
LIARHPAAVWVRRIPRVQTAGPVCRRAGLQADRVSGSVTPPIQPSQTEEAQMAGPTNAPEPRMDASDLYREDIYSDRKVGTIRVLTPVKSDGTPDPARAMSYVGQAQIMTPAGVLPLSFEIPARTLADACAGFADAAKIAFDETMKELQELRRQQASSIVIPDASAASAISGGGLPPRGKIQFP